MERKGLRARNRAQGARKGERETYPRRGSILITNDDGISAPGLVELERALRKRYGGRIVTVAPAFQSTATSRSISLLKALRCDEIAPGRYAVEGTPVDCVLWGIRFLLKGDAALVISGINHGPNLGHDIAYSGTVSAALEAARLGIPALAASLAAEKAEDFSEAVGYTMKFVRRLLRRPLPEGVAVSVNVPGGIPKGVRVTRPGNAMFANKILERRDPFGRPYYWLAGGGRVRKRHEPGTDINAVLDGYISVTPLDSDLFAPYTDLNFLEE